MTVVVVVMVMVMGIIIIIVIIVMMVVVVGVIVMVTPAASDATAAAPRRHRLAPRDLQERLARALPVPRPWPAVGEPAVICGPGGRGRERDGCWCGRLVDDGEEAAVFGGASLLTPEIFLRGGWGLGRGGVDGRGEAGGR